MNEITLTSQLSGIIGLLSIFIFLGYWLVYLTDSLEEVDTLPELILICLPLGIYINLIIILFESIFENLKYNTNRVMKKEKNNNYD